MSYAWRVRRLATLLEEHREAVGEFMDCARSIPDARWLVPRAQGKWTPAQETRHLILAYDGIIADLRDEHRVALKGTAFHRMIWRAYGLPHVLWRKRIPVAVRAPREFRPQEETAPRAELLAWYETRSRDYCELFTDKWQTDPRRRVTHPWFGTLNLDQAMRLATVHTRHHAAFLQHLAM